ncbi:MAG: lipopolysaccharide biosynthesis protein RfbH [Candidatus Magasanikbacteria bacterium CG10_big_fil_rev_8_21_14_0_10_36_32]|uniref:Lipopolysaccharide biosynthesis protein RfbH n=1 Tax=Candidatus Magasanikbacteria bacterium CG10_big_fil_rev_8_21_14_0_10_36_32 TaxID=1974646 RepID=A0A2M6W5S7_9BACT|nr:MAG: lipopolysaccharide biosynthesis protein RfbH [Candidatus Magasanikbacteria bacterium CG10_big_fil_rev_8_21_14_0_10_36_32]
MSLNEKIIQGISEEYQIKFPAKKFIPGQSAVPISGKVFDEKELIFMTEAVMEGWWTEGKYSEQLELKIASYIGIKHCTLVNSGSSANLLALTALTSVKLPVEKRLKPGDEVITVAAGFPTTVNPIIQNNLIPVFVDVELGSYNPNLELIKKAVSEKTRAVIIAHTLGNPYKVDEIAEFCREKGFWLIEDNCDALGSEYKNKKTGSFGHISTLSFYPAHHITTAEGGAVLTDDTLLNKIVRSLRDWGRDCWCPTGKDDTCKNRFNWQLGDLPFGYDHKYIYSELGYNLKMTDIQAALGLAQVEKLDSFVNKRKENFKLLNEQLKKFENHLILPECLPEADPSWFGFLISIKENSGINRTELLKYLNDKKIGTRLLFAGNIIKQPYFVENKYSYKVAGDLKNTDYIMNNSFWIGLGPLVNREMIEYVGQVFGEFINK